MLLRIYSGQYYCIVIQRKKENGNGKERKDGKKRHKRKAKEKNASFLFPELWLRTIEQAPASI